MRPRFHSGLIFFASAFALGAALPALAETFTYDALGRLVSLSVPGGSTTYAYDPAHNWTSVSSVAGGGGLALVAAPPAGETVRGVQVAGVLAGQSAIAPRPGDAPLALRTGPAPVDRPGAQ